MQLGRWMVYAAASASLALVGRAGVAEAQGTITGRVTQDGGQPVSDARVLAIGTSLSTMTND